MRTAFLGGEGVAHDHGGFSFSAMSRGRAPSRRRKIDRFSTYLSVDLAVRPRPAPARRAIAPSTAPRRGGEHAVDQRLVRTDPPLPPLDDSLPFVPPQRRGASGSAAPRPRPARAQPPTWASSSCLTIAPPVPSCVTPASNRRASAPTRDASHSDRDEGSFHSPCPARTGRLHHGVPRLRVLRGPGPPRPAGHAGRPSGGRGRLGPRHEDRALDPHLRDLRDLAAAQGRRGAAHHGPRPGGQLRGRRRELRALAGPQGRRGVDARARAHVHPRARRPGQGRRRARAAAGAAARGGAVHRGHRDRAPDARRRRGRAAAAAGPPSRSSTGCCWTVGGCTSCVGRVGGGVPGTGRSLLGGRRAPGRRRRDRVRARAQRAGGDRAVGEPRGRRTGHPAATAARRAVRDLGAASPSPTKAGSALPDARRPWTC